MYLVLRLTESTFGKFRKFIFWPVSKFSLKNGLSNKKLTIEGVVGKAFSKYKCKVFVKINFAFKKVLFIIIITQTLFTFIMP